MREVNLPFEVPGVTTPLPDGELVGPDPPPPAGLAIAPESPATTAPPRPDAQGNVALAAAPANELQAAAIGLLLQGRTKEQREAILHGEGPLLLFAGPGAGKTATLTRRVAFLLQSGMARPEEILAVTFTVRAADEMRVRLIDLLGSQAVRHLTVCTFHSLCARIVRSHAAAFGRTADYSIHDPATMGRVVKAVMSDTERARIQYEIARCGEAPIKEVISEISLAKNNLWGPDDYAERSRHPLRSLIAELWREIEIELRQSNSFDFDDLLTCCATLLTSHERLRLYYRDRYRWLLVDEFQDTNAAQMEIVRLLMGAHGNVTVVADDDQAIYGFRGAEVGNVLNFRSDFPGARAITLGANFRCRSEILGAAVSAVGHNSARQPKALIATRGAGGVVQVRHYPSDEEEASAVTAQVEAEINAGRDPKEIIVLCRNGYPMRGLQNRLQERGIKVRLIGGQSLWERSEIKDAVAYLTLLANPYDAAAFERAVTAPHDRKPFSKGGVKAPTRGIDKGVGLIVAFARDQGIDLIDATLRAGEVPGVRRPAQQALAEFGTSLDRIRREAWQSTISGVGRVVTETLVMPGGVVSTYQLLRDKAQDRNVRLDAARVLEDLRSLVRSAQAYEENSADIAPTLTGFLEMLGVDESRELDAEHDDRLTISTIHGAKGTEAQLVVLVGAEEGLLPSQRALEETTRTAIEEERRLFYVALTRAKDAVIVTTVGVRGGRATNGPSRFLNEAGLR